MTNPMGPERPDATFPDPSPAHPPNPDRTPSGGINVLGCVPPQSAPPPQPSSASE